MIRLVFVVLLICLTTFTIAAEDHHNQVQWKWLSGASVSQQTGNCGGAGQFSMSYSPGSRRNFGMTPFSQKDGTLYVYGGDGKSNTGLDGRLSDVWAYRQTSYEGKGEWAWLSGSTSSVNSAAVYSGPNTHPGSRVASVIWTFPPLSSSPQNDPFLYVFGGKEPSIGGQLCDLWALNVTSFNWKFRKGSTSANDQAMYGNKGLFEPSTRPGGMDSPAVLHISDELKMFLFGGLGRCDSSPLGYLADTWVYKAGTNMWSWVNGPSLVNANTQVGPKGVFASTNHPGGRHSISVMGELKDGIVYIYGGMGKSTSTSTTLADLWAYRLSDDTWAWIGGDVSGSNVLSSYDGYSAHPGSRREGTAWSTPWISGMGYLFAGMGYAASTTIGKLNDLWSFNATSVKWLWIGGDSVINTSGWYNDSTSFSPVNKPGGLSFLRSCLNSRIDTVNVFGGVVYSSSGTEMSNTLWSLAPLDLRRNNLHTVQWKMMSGRKILNTKSVGGPSGVFSSQYTPGARKYMGMTSHDCNGLVWLYGGNGHSENSNGELGDLWSYRQATFDGIGEWSWMGGHKAEVDQYGDYASTSPQPGSRDGCVMWCRGDKAYVMGGHGYAASGAVNRRLNDVWLFDTATKKWTWKHGSSLIDQKAMYGVKGDFDMLNHPGAVQYHSLLHFSDQDVAVKFGGSGFDSTSSSGLSDVWSYDLASDLWSWVAGPSIRDQASIGGNSGVFSSDFFPGGRQWCAVFPSTSSNRAWIYGGNGRTTPVKTGYLADLWGFQFNRTMGTYEWAYVAGDSVNVGSSVKGYHAVLGSYVPPATVSSRYAVSGLMSHNLNLGLLYLFGGDGFHEKSTTMAEAMGDFYAFDLNLNRWAWISGYSESSRPGNYNESNVFSAANMPGCRYGHSMFTIRSIGLSFVFGGFGYGEVKGSQGHLNDLFGTKGPISQSVSSNVDSPTAPPVPSSLPPPSILPSRYSTAYILGLVASILMVVGLLVPLVSIHIHKGDIPMIAGALPCLQAIQFSAVSSQYALNMPVVYREFASAFSWTLLIINGPIVTPTPTPTAATSTSTTGRQLLSASFASSTEIASVLPNLLLWIVIGSVVLGLYVAFVGWRWRKKRIYEGGERVVYWRRYVGMYLRFIGAVYYALCWATLSVFAQSSIGVGFIVLAALVLCGLVLGYPFIGVRKIPATKKYPEVTTSRRFKVIYGGFFGGLKPNRYWYAIVLIVIKFFIGVCVALLHSNPTVQAALICSIHLGYVSVLIWTKPYVSNLHLKLWTLYSGLQLLAHALLWIFSYVSSSAAVGIIQAIFVCFIQSALIGIFAKQSLDAAGLRLNRRMKLILGCGFEWRWLLKWCEEDSKDGDKGAREGEGGEEEMEAVKV